MTATLTASAALRFRAMATQVTVQLVLPQGEAGVDLTRVRELFERVEAACTRFDPAGPLARANAEPGAVHPLPPECVAAISEAYQAYRLTEGRFDPRVLTDLLRLGYDRSLPFDRGDVHLPPEPVATQPVWGPRGSAAGRGDWQPEIDPDRSTVRLGAHPIDLGGIGKGLAVRWAGAELTGLGVARLVEAGGDLLASGAGPEGEGWLVGIENPNRPVTLKGPATPESPVSPDSPGTSDTSGDETEPAEPLAVLRLRDLACATSSVRVRSWRQGGRRVHHLIDPRTGEPGAGGLSAVTVVAADPALAEVWSKALFLEGAVGIEKLCHERQLAAYWVGADGATGHSSALAPYLTWQASNA